MGDQDETEYTGSAPIPGAIEAKTPEPVLSTGPAGKPHVEDKPEEEKADLYDWLQCFITALVACILIFVFVARTCGVIGPSMQSTLFEGDRLVISGLFYTPKQGDIVILRKEAFKTDPLVKRVVAVGGQTVDIDFDEGIVYVDGEALDEPYINEPTYRRLSFQGPLTVPEGSVFVMGDNRNHSNDSRDVTIGCVDNRYILGKALFRIYPFNRIGFL